MSVKLTFTARDAAHAAQIAAAVAAVDAGPASTDILVAPDGSGAPTGHTYRELCDARRAGILVADMTPRGLVFTPAALATYRRTKAERRKPKRSSAPVSDLSEHRIARLESAGIKVR